MALEPRGDSSLFSCVVREPLDAVVAPLVRDALVHDALSLAGLKTPPLERSALNKFIAGPIRSVLERALGAELGLSVAEEMQRALATASPALPRPPRTNARIPRPRTQSRSAPPPSSRSNPMASSRPVSPPAANTWSVPPTSAGNAVPDSSPRSSPPSTQRSRPTPVPYGMRRPTPPPGMVDARSTPPTLPDPASAFDSMRPPPVSGEVKRRSRPPASRAPGLHSIAVPRSGVVLIASEERTVFDALAMRFEDRARVRRVLSAADVVRALDEAGAGRKLVLLDAKAPSVRPAALAVLLENMPGVEVVLFRSVQETEEAVLAVSATTAKWIIYRDPASLEHVAAACLTLVS